MFADLRLQSHFLSFLLLQEETPMLPMQGIKVRGVTSCAHVGQLASRRIEYNTAASGKSHNDSESSR